MKSASLKASMKRIPLLALFFLLGPAPLHANDMQDILECVSEKAGPEGDLPPSGPLREKILQGMQGGPQACIGRIETACQEAGGDINVCIKRESQAWLAALKHEGSYASPRNKAAYETAIAAIVPRARALCEAAAATSAWGAETVKTKGRFGFDIDKPCMRDAIAQQSLVILVQSRGN